MPRAVTRAITVGQGVKMGSLRAETGDRTAPAFNTRGHHVSQLESAHELEHSHRGNTPREYPLRYIGAAPPQTFSFWRV